MVICPFAPYGVAHGPKTCQICHKLGPDFVERISLKLLDGFTPFGTKVGLNMVINISSGFFHIRQKKILAIFFRIFQLRTWKITVNTLTSIIFHGSFSNLARTFIVLRSRTSSIMEVLPH